MISPTLGIKFFMTRYKDALRAYDMSLRFKPDFNLAYYGKGLALEKLKRLKEAIKALKRAFQLRVGEQ
jgi:tetratricopeptide (TPR) repeat protein